MFHLVQYVRVTIRAAQVGGGKLISKAGNSRQLL